MKFKLPKITHHRNPADRTFIEKIARRFILPPHGPFSLPIGQWGVRDDRLKSSFPWRFFIWDTVPIWWSHNFTQRKKNVRNWIRFRTWDRYDVLKMEISKDYHDPDYILLHANFQILKDFVEIELAAMNDATSEDEPETDDISSFLGNFGKKFRRYKRKRIRNPSSGLKHLDWEIAETSGTQTASAQEKKLLYLWWTQVRPTRADPYEHPLFNEPQDLSEDQSFAAIFNRPHNKELAEARSKLEAFYEEEDEEMLIRLIKVRRSMWT